MAGDDSDDVSEQVARLQSEGANVLVTGAVPEDAHADAASSMLGDDQQHRRLVVLSGRELADVDQYLPAQAPRDPEHLRVVYHEVPTRSVADGGSPPDAPGLGEAVVTEVPGDDLPGLGATISETVDTFEAITGGLDPAELRVSLDSVSTLVSEFGETEVFGFFHILTERVDRADALSYFHLQADRDDPSVAMLESLFDAVVQLRVEDGTTQRRWTVDGDSTEWSPVDAG